MVFSTEYITLSNLEPQQDTTSDTDNIEKCPWCNEPERYRVRDGTSARVCLNRHMWLQCSLCEAFFDTLPSKDYCKRVLHMNHNEWFYNMRFLCNECCLQRCTDLCSICGTERQKHTCIDVPNVHGFTEHIDYEKEMRR